MLRAIRALTSQGKALRLSCSRLQRTQADFITVDLDLALTFLEVAATTTSPVTRARNIRNAQCAYETMRTLVARDLRCTSAQRKRILAALAALEQRLRSFNIE